MPEVSNRDYKRLQSLKDEGDGGNPFKVSYSAAGGKVMSFSAPGVTKFSAYKKAEKEKPRQLKNKDKNPDKPTDEVKPDKPTTVKKSTKVTSKELEDAVSGGFITLEEATGGEWGPKNAAGGGNKTYNKKLAANVAAHDGVAVGKKFTGVRAGSKTPPRGPNSPSGDTAPIWDSPTPAPAPSGNNTSSNVKPAAPIGMNNPNVGQQFKP